MTTTSVVDREKAVLAGVRTEPAHRAGHGAGRERRKDADRRGPGHGRGADRGRRRDPEDGRAALDAAVAAQASWAATPPRDRGRDPAPRLRLITARADDFALLMTLEMGKPLAESKAEIAYAAEFFRWFSEEAVRISGRCAAAPNGATRLLTMKQPVGPCLLITPWNFPLAMGTRKIGPAIAAGCTMVVKPAKLTPLSMLALAEILPRRACPPVSSTWSPPRTHGRVTGAAHRRPAAAQAVLHRLDRGRPEAGRAVRRAGAAGVHGAGRQRAVPGLRGRRPRRRRRRRDAGEDAQHGRGLHRREPVHRARVRRRRVRPPAGRADGRR